jgi:SAM-dependent methyltransferase
MTVEKKEIKCIRKSYFFKNYNFDIEFNDLLNVTENIEFSYLKNPVIQNIYKYQVEYLYSISKKWFDNEKIKILDWGCGLCHVSYWLKKMGMDVTSCDKQDTTSAFVIKNPIAEKADINIIKLDHDYFLPFDNESFDIVLSFGVLEHVTNDLESLNEIFRILKPNGLFFCFYLPYKWSYTQNILHLCGNWYHSKLYRKKMVVELIKKANLEVLDIWHRALFPKKSFVPPFYKILERIDNFLCNYSPLKYFATNIEFVARKME